MASRYAAPIDRLLHPFLPGLVAARRRIQRRGWRAWFHRERQPIEDTLKTTVACVMAWTIAAAVFSHHNPLLAPLTALLTVQVTAKATVVRGAQQVLGVIIGVLAAFALTHALGFHAWSVGITVFGSLLVGRALRLGPQATGVATTGLLVLSLGAKGGAYAGDRVLETLIGAAVGAFITLVTPSRRDLMAAGVALGGVADDTGDLLHDIAQALDAGDDAHKQATLWQNRARRLNAEVTAEQELRHAAQDGSSLEPRVFRDPGRLEQFHQAGKVVAHNVGHLQTLTDALREWAELRSHQPTPTLSEWLSVRVSELLEALSEGAGAFGRIQRLPPDLCGPVVDQLRAAIVTAEALQINAELLAEVTDRRAWPVAGSVLDATAAMAVELDPDNGRHFGACPFSVLPKDAPGEDAEHC